MTSRDVRLTLSFVEGLAEYLPDAVDRLNYLLPTLEFVIDGSKLEITGLTSRPVDVVTREIRYTVYREKISAQSAPLRTAMFNALFG